MWHSCGHKRRDEVGLLYYSIAGIIVNNGRTRIIPRLQQRPSSYLSWLLSSLRSRSDDLSFTLCHSIEDGVDQRS